MPKPDLETRLLRAIHEARPLQEGETVVLAVSGGLDSMVLLNLVARMNQLRGLGLQLHVAHVNHNLRHQDSDADAEFVTAQARALKVACTVESADVAARSREWGVSVELAARRCRYDFFERLCLRLGAKVVLLAHHADDNVETILHRIVRGTGIRGLGGIRPIRPIRHGSDIDLVRPLLGVRRAELEDFVQAQQIPFRVDASNNSAVYSRNRIRNDLLPIIRDRFNPQVDDALLRLSEQARGLEAYLRETCTRMLESIIVEHNNRQLVVHGPSLGRRPRVIQTQLIREIILRFGLGEGEFAFSHLNAVADLLASGEGTKEIHLPGGLRVSRRYSRLVFERDAGQETPDTFEQELCISTEGTTRLTAFGMEIEVTTFPANDELIGEHLRKRMDREQFSYEEWLDADEVHPPLLARPRRPGDRFFPLGSPGMKKLSDFLIDEKIEARQREKLIILCDQLGPIWVVPLRIDGRVRLTRLTRRVLRIIARPLSETPDA